MRKTEAQSSADGLYRQALGSAPRCANPKGQPELVRVAGRKMKFGVYNHTLCILVVVHRNVRASWRPSDRLMATLPPRPAWCRSWPHLSAQPFARYKNAPVPHRFSLSSPHSSPSCTAPLVPQAAPKEIKKHTFTGFATIDRAIFTHIYKIARSEAFNARNIRAGWSRVGI
jgi:hypothetical protein